MDWRDKISKLVGDRNKSQISRGAGLPSNAIDAALNKGQEPRATRATKIARALGVSADWLFDDSRDWDDRVDSSKPDLNAMNEFELLATASARLTLYYESRIDLFNQITRAKVKNVRIEMSDEDVQQIIEDIKQCATVAEFAFNHLCIMERALSNIEHGIATADVVFGSEFYKKLFMNRTQASPLSEKLREIIDRYQVGTQDHKKE